MSFASIKKYSSDRIFDDNFITCCNVKDVVVLGEWDGEGFALDDAVEAELFPLVDGVDADDVAQLLDDVRHHGR